MAIAAILFDKDGTLIDFDRTWGPAAYVAMQALARGDAAALARLIEINHYIEEERRFLPTSPMVAGSSASYGPLWAQILGRNDHAALFAEMDSLMLEAGLASLAPIGRPVAVMQHLRHAGYRLGIATNDAEASALAQLDALDLTPHLDFVAGYDSGHGAKPAPGMVLAFARALAIAPEQVALVGDSTHDLHAARAAGALAVAVLTGPASRDELAPHADHVVGSIHDLPALFDALRTAA
jgi:phosphoglycolate phosphatase